MASIDVKRFVDINIQYKQISKVTSTRDTVILFSSDLPSTFEDTTYSTYQDYLDSDFAKGSSSETVTAYVKIFFDNGGNKIRLKYVASKDNLNNAILSLNDEYIIVAYAFVDTVTDNNFSIMKNIADTRDTNPKIYGINQKILLSRTTLSSNSALTTNNFAIKYSQILGAEMTIAAYLSNINVYEVNSVQDYAFTKEIITQEPNNEETLNSCMNNNLNVDMKLSNAIRNLGGNLSNGKDLVNQYVLIIMHQTLTEKVLNVLSQKIKGNQGIAALYSTISEELNNYVNCGYLSIDKIWQDNNLTVDKNNNTYTIIEKGTALNTGYKITILPFSSLTETEKQNRQAPLIYIIIADSYGIRKVTINGEVI